MAIPFQKGPIQLNAFPGILSGRGENASRIRAQITIGIFDRYTGEKFTRVIPLETDESSDIVPWLKAALEHARTEGDVRSFCEKRDG